YAGVTDPAHLAELEMNDQLTIEAWIFPRGAGTDGGGGVIVNKEGEYALTRWSDGRITWSLDNSSPNWASIQSTYVAPEREWTHVAFVYDGPGEEALLYINGALHQTWFASGSIGDHHSGLDELRIGYRQNNAQGFHGVIDEVRVWNRARNGGEIGLDYDTVIADPASEVGLVGYWRFDEGTGRIATDLAGGHSARLGATDGTSAPDRTWAPALPGYSLDSLACGNGDIDPLETCDDGGSAGGDGCSSTCRIENVLTLYGNPAGGTVSVVVEGVTVQITTFAGQTDQDVLDALAAAIANHPTLIGLRVTVVRIGNELFIGGSFENTVVTDGGLSDCSAGPSIPVIAGAMVNVCPETSVTLSTGSYDTYEWFYESQTIPGADADTYEVTLTGNYSVKVRDSFGCPADSSQEMAFVGFCPESEISPKGAIFPLRIEKSTDSSTGYYVYFQSLDDVFGYNAYAGTVGTWFDHGGGGDDACDVVFTDLGSGEIRAELPAAAATDAYFLVTGFDGSDEGVAHTDSSDNPSDPAQNSCLP
ncbi:MAG: LamG domain-containing protein, partial [Acidobacteriota bacterium]|nr:LamG domain-containing protein [Acidobacteriota bacterium]